MRHVETGLAPTILIHPPARIELQLSWRERLMIALVWVTLSVAGAVAFFGSYEVKKALGIDLVPGYHIQDVLPFYPR